jgi:hypothetical protein
MPTSRRASRRFRRRNRTVELATATGGFGARALRAALDSSPLWGAGRVEDTINLMGHALRKALGVIAVLQGRGQAEGIAGLAEQAGAPMLAASSLKAALDRDWDDPAARDAALAEVLGCLDAVEAFASRSVLFDGYKRHVLTDLDTGLIPAVGITPANVPEATVTDDITA